MSSATRDLTGTLAVHTDAPRALLRTMVRPNDVFGGLAAYGERDCIYGWSEPQNDGGRCRDHNLVYADDEETVRWVGETLISLGYLVVVSSAAVWPEQRHEDMPFNYDDDHGH